MKRFVLLLLAALPAACGDGGPTTPTPPSPVVSTIAPASGPVQGGTAVTITGSNFSSPATVTIGGVPATNVTVASATSISATTAARAAGTVDVTVRVGDRAGTLPNGFTYAAGQAPVLQALSARGSRPNQPERFADLGEEIAVTATVVDPDTPASSLTFDWSAPAGTFAGSGASVRWRAPQTLTTPGSVLLTARVSDGANQVSGTVSVRVHDSQREVGDMARRFLTEFSKPQTNKDWRDIMRDFPEPAACPHQGEVEAEREEVMRHYTYFFMHAYDIGPATVQVNFGGTCYAGLRGDACMAVPVSWDSTDSRTNIRGTTSGTAHLTGVYSTSDARWWLCSSRYQATMSIGHTFYSSR